MTRYVCIHGHFYQPPRENPWLDAIERQPSAAPFHDWNERITAECYAPNAEARWLDDEGRLARRVDNYRRISFNFGPTLLSWMERSNPTVYAAILEADRASRAIHGGHGAAMAQVYGHAILPLASARDQKTQVIWGARDFEHRFGRRAEGMWLAETAVDTPSLEALAQEGVKFAILAPHQARRIRPLTAAGEREPWRDARVGVDTTRAYQARLPSGRTIALFFYNGEISRAVAFDGLLQSGERFADRLVSAFDAGEARAGARLVHIATDGETYGHHHRHGEMALAWALDRIDSQGLAKPTVYGRFLALHPPEWQVEIAEETSWSCAHGVERWRSDCGCRMDGRTNQAWRRPLRRAFDDLGERLALAYEREAGRLLHDPWAARNASLELTLDPSDRAREKFFSEQAARPLDRAERLRALGLLEMQRAAVLMFASCGWFFDDVRGLETEQILRFAGRAIELGERLCGESFEAPFLAELSQAKSNDPASGFPDGAAVYRHAVGAARTTLADVAGHAAVLSLFEERPNHDRIYAFEVERTATRRLDSGASHLVSGRLAVVSIATREREEFGYIAVSWGDHNVHLGLAPDGAAPDLADLETLFRADDRLRILRALDAAFPIHRGLDALRSDERERALHRLLAATTAEVQGEISEVLGRRVPLLRFVAALGVELPPPLRGAAELAIGVELGRALDDPSSDLGRLHGVLSDVRTFGLELDRAAVGRALERAAIAAAEAIADGSGLGETSGGTSAIERLGALLDLADALPFRPDLAAVQVAFFRALERAAGALDRAAAAPLATLAARLRVRFEVHSDFNAARPLPIWQVPI